MRAAGYGHLHTDTVLAKGTAAAFSKTRRRRSLLPGVCRKASLKIRYAFNDSLLQNL